MYPPIVVTGPQRSGTTIASKIIAADLFRTAVDESEFTFGEDYSNCVLQLPQALDHYIYLQHIYPGIQFLFVSRDPKDIIASMKRVEWCAGDVYDWELFLERYVTSRILLWNHIKQMIPESCSEIHYESLSDHPLFIPKEGRKDFTIKQWRADSPVGPSYWRNNTECTTILYGSRHTTSS